MIYDKLRNVCGTSYHPGLTEIIRSFGMKPMYELLELQTKLFSGHLSGENNYNKRIYLEAKLVRYTEDSITLDLRTDTFAKDQPW